MNINAVLNNLKKKGLKQTLEIRKKRKKDRNAGMLVARKAGGVLEELLVELKKIAEEIKQDASVISSIGDDRFCMIRKAASVTAQNRNTLKKYKPELLEEIESLFESIESSAACRNWYRKKYIKEIIPEIYRQNCEKPIENKVIFMENGNSPSPSSSLLSNTIMNRKLYDVHYAGMKIRQVPWVEYYENACRFIEDLATAKALFMSTANDFLSHFEVREETKVIQLWHGVGVFKKVGYSTIGKSFGRNAAARAEYDQYRNYDYVTIAAEEQTWIFEDAMHLEKSQIAPIGVARTDVFYDEKYINDTYGKLYKAFPQAKGKKIILYAPTFRGETANAKAPDRLDIRKFADALSDDYILLIKHHGLSKDIPPIPDDLENTFAFDMNRNKVLSIERLLAIADICITDYSSIAFEYAIMERPLIFFAYDLEDYIDERGLYYDYDEITPGPVCKTNEEMIEYIKNIDENFDKNKIHQFKQKHVGACDGHAVDRTIELIEK